MALFGVSFPSFWLGIVLILLFSEALGLLPPSGLAAYGIKVFPATILGGLDSIGGAVLGGIIIGLLENIAQYVDSEYLHWGNLYEIAPFYVMIIILMIKPYGLFGTKDIERV